MEFYQYKIMVIGCSIVLFLLEICLFAFLSNRLLAELIEKMFEIIRTDHQNFKMNFYGIQIELTTSRRFRLSLASQLSFITWITILLLMDGCVMQVHYLSTKDLCPIPISDCFTIGKLSTNERVVCQSGQILSNLTSSNVVCFIWVYAEQNTLNILNQIGICSSVFSLLCHTFKCSCRMSRKWWGLILLILLVLACQSLFIISLIINIPVTMTAKLLLVALSCLIINVLQLLQFTHHYKYYHSVTVIK
jgi:hypothetical protein